MTRKDRDIQRRLRILRHDFIAQRRMASHPHAPPLGGGDLVTNALADHFPLELGKGEHHVERQSAH